MFRKLWKTLRFFIILAIVLICLPHSILPRRADNVAPDELQNYLMLNESETRLIEYKDTEEALKLKLAQLSVINESRRKNKAPLLKLDILASRVANRMSREAAENNYLGHWNMAGEKPYQRYALAGGNDHLTENAYGLQSSTGFNSSPLKIGELMKSAHGSFMAERAPNDGHRATVINKAHNYVGIGYHVTGRQFRYYEEYIDRYLEFQNIPSETSLNEEVSLKINTDGKQFLYYMIIYRDKLPEPLTPAQINRKGAYPDFGDEEYKVYPAWELSAYRNGTTYTIPVKFSKEGLYYIQLFTDRREVTRNSSLTTKGKSPVSGIVIKAGNGTRS